MRLAVALIVALGLLDVALALGELPPTAGCHHLSPTAAAATAANQWAVPTNFTGPVKLLTDEPPRQLCFTVQPDAPSLTLLFNRVRLPEGASLRVCPAAPSTASCAELGAGRLLVSVLGSTAIVSFTPGASEAEDAVAELSAVLQGVRPLPSLLATTAAGAAQRKAVSADRATALEQALSGVLGTSNVACPYLDIACAGSEWQQFAAAVVLLLLASPKGAVLNTAHLGGGAAYILSASHCREFDSDGDAQFYQAVFNHQRTTCPTASPEQSGFSLLLGGGSGVAPMLDLQGMQVAWQDEESDVLLLRVDSGIPAEFGAGALGWDASGWAAADTEVATVSHPCGDLKKLSRSTAGLQRASYAPQGGQPTSGETHYWVQWTQGGSDTGSSGAPLIDVSRGHVIGMLTGGEAATCKNKDYFGSLRAAWERGLWQVLSPSGPDAVTSMPAVAPPGPPSTAAQTVDGEAQQAQQGAAAEDGDTPSQAIAVQGDAQLNFAADGELRFPSTPPSAALAPVRLGQPLASLVPPGLLPLGGIRFYNISSALTLGDLTVSACAGDVPLQVAVFAGGAASWVSTEPCSLPGGSCTATNTTGGCSGLQGLRLPGQGDGDAWPGSEPYTVAVLPLLPALPISSIHDFEFHVTSAYVPPTFALSGN
ncbi:T9SS C-terminal target domain-containing [Chlorella sorokiniana]|uniref:T9SS C-terminal target domain-containing n=1 Tax=Chlorella sorokiniana TaxID=3076 RepID=A0A2P6TNH3_CHLSO|nr:T9SS C-terminal target domain-containing [Chlorella sorokiniana]|eukprot:PRW50891.1 T9SS C-terminal target domain-containing [Chlorella sorokiniana]